MEAREELINLRLSTGMNKRQFSEYFGIPYRTFQDWELGNRRVPPYLLRLMAYKVEMEKLDQNVEERKQKRRRSTRAKAAETKAAEE
ncbi:hypothetical protein B5F07_01510 [Lachnoclostridium sp. An169]|uniref:transcriptional regulator n=1 Tax=Lachnoclostridium sp. An169 TaxID=1965569 RepID=UPI000B38F826|nr:transcriptional regulator [Lachnoclostridium sp. An169]OUP86692.1 hypothetical protein B5F07_01510 [Lachnoclostridium sp. An169]HJA65748.1 transcriptional regulator [Candidatus Mediterraneibacter cottocaccae]